MLQEAEAQQQQQEGRAEEQLEEDTGGYEAMDLAQAQGRAAAALPQVFRSGPGLQSNGNGHLGAGHMRSMVRFLDAAGR
jgi:hypothetical protein